MVGFWSTLFTIGQNRILLLEMDDCYRLLEQKLVAMKYNIFSLNTMTIVLHKKMHHVWAVNKENVVFLAPIYI
jgi:hypothetical protein